MLFCAPLRHSAPPLPSGQVSRRQQPVRHHPQRGRSPHLDDRAVRSPPPTPGASGHPCSRSDRFSPAQHAPAPRAQCLVPLSPSAMPTCFVAAPSRSTLRTAYYLVCTAGLPYCMVFTVRFLLYILSTACLALYALRSTLYGASYILCIIRDTL